VTIEIEFAPILEQKFFWEHLPLSLKDAIEKERLSMYKSWFQLKPPVRDALDYMTIPIIAPGGKTFQVSYAVRTVVRGTKVLVLHIY